MIKTLTDIFNDILSIFKGLAVTGKNMFRKNVTIEYPLKKAAMTARFRGMVDLAPAKCITCSQCIKICPTAALDLVAPADPETKKKVLKAFTFNGEICCFCGLCAEVCPTMAITMNQVYEVAYYDRKDLTAIDLMKADKYDRFKCVTPGKGGK